MKIFSKYILALGALFFLNLVRTTAQEGADPDCSKAECKTTTINIGTGIDQSTNLLYPAGSGDAYWQLVAVPSNAGNITVPRPAFVIAPFIGWGTALTNAGWISGQPQAEWGIISTQSYDFERCFCTCKEGSFKFDLKLQGDNSAVLSLTKSDGSTIPLLQTSSPYGHADPGASVVKSELLKPGRHCLRAKLYNASPPAMGLKIQGNITGTGLLKDNCCGTGAGTILGFKYLDKNCDGQFSGTDTKLSGWTIQLKNTSGIVIQTAVTDATGYYYFNNLSPGTYSVNEMAQSGFYAKNPSTSSYTGVAVAIGQVIQLNFGNCEGKPQNVCCSDLKNILVNSDFSANTAINSTYQFNASVNADAVRPGQYIITGQAGAASICKNWIAADHTSCATSGTFMAVNGRTGQTGKAKIWEQTFALSKDKSYSFCTNFKNLPACCFDVLPKVDVRFNIDGGTHDVLNEIINKGAGLCDWHWVRKQFNAGSNTSVTVSVWLDETGVGDGNDLVMDDFSFVEIPQATNQDVNFIQSSFVDLGNGTYTFAIQATSPLPTTAGNCGVWYEVCEIDASGNCIANTTVSNPPGWWPLPNYPTTINFAGYNGTFTLGDPTQPGVFSYSKSYAIRRGVFCDCLAWKDQTIKIIPGANHKLQFIDSATGKDIMIKQGIKKTARKSKKIN